MSKEKVYVVYSGRRDGSFGTNNEIEEEIWKVVSTKQKAIDLIMTGAGLAPDEFGCAKYNLENYPHNGHDDIDYEYYRFEEHDIE